MLSTKIRFNSRHKEVIAKNAMAMDMALAHMAQDIEIGIKTERTPFKKGSLRDRTHHTKRAVLKYQVIVPVEYAEVQEVGRRKGSREFTNYTTPNTGKGYFKHAVEKTTRNAPHYFKTSAKVVM